MSNTYSNRPAALREWAVAVKALKEGRMIVALRKGGIAEETRDFKLISKGFYLLPGYEHQKPELLKEEYRGGIAETLADWRPDSGTVTIDVYAEAEEDIEIRDQQTLNKLRDFHIWTDTFAEERLRWKRTKPLHLLLLRVYTLETPAVMPLRDSYAGCKSWVALEDPLPESPRIPVLTDERFARAAAGIKEALSR
ncbi:DUF1802 family protein [Paenibacillus humicola]|uniref:DUF1802 family protein n=1 Tax=Paenibacillus humicola TaxID=3110540 RepID=UPI00237AE55F|nr:DUF1802 family protein [Paenibacillus humicola]